MSLQEESFCVNNFTYLTTDYSIWDLKRLKKNTYLNGLTDIIS